MNIDFEQIRELLEIVSSTDISELTIESGQEKVTVKKSGFIQTIKNDNSASSAEFQMQIPTRQVALSTQTEAEKEASTQAATDKKLVSITSPMVGTFYRASSPTTEPFAELGDLIQVGQTVCIIEAMKLMNDLPAEVSGKVVKICAENGTTVEYGQTLFLLDPEG